MSDLATISLIATYSAMAVYTFAFVLFTVDLAGRTATEGESKPTRWLRSAMVTAAFVAPFLLEATRRFVLAAARVPGVFWSSRRDSRER